MCWVWKIAQCCDHSLNQKCTAGPVRSRKKSGGEGSTHAFASVVLTMKWFSYIKLFGGMAVSISKEGDPPKSCLIGRQCTLLLNEYFFFLFSLLAPQEIQAAQPECNVKLCTRDDFDEIRTAMADHVICFRIGRHTICPLTQDARDSLGVLVFIINVRSGQKAEVVM